MASEAPPPNAEAVIAPHGAPWSLSWPAPLDIVGQSFRTAIPFRHVVLDRFLRGDPSAFEFPDLDDRQMWHRSGSPYQPGKMTLHDVARMPPSLRDLIQILNSATFLRQVEAVTSISALIPDPYLEGGGLHVSPPGGHLELHTDFHLHSALPLFRRLNLIVYLNPEWGDNDGGELELWDEAAMAGAVVRAAPRFGSAVLFETDDHSVHGVAPVRERATYPRRSLALYYYTVHDSSEYAGDSNAYYRRHYRHGGFVGLRLHAYRALIWGSRALSKSARRVRPDVFVEEGPMPALRSGRP